MLAMSESDFTSNVIPPIWPLDRPVLSCNIRMWFYIHPQQQPGVMHTVCRTFHGYTEEHLNANMKSYRGKHGILKFEYMPALEPIDKEPSEKRS